MKNLNQVLSINLAILILYYVKKKNKDIVLNLIFLKNIM